MGTRSSSESESALLARRLQIDVDAELASEIAVLDSAAVASTRAQALNSYGDDTLVAGAGSRVTGSGSMGFSAFCNSLLSRGAAASDSLERWRPSSAASSQALARQSSEEQQQQQNAISQAAAVAAAAEAAAAEAAAAEAAVAAAATTSELP